MGWWMFVNPGLIKKNATALKGKDLLGMELLQGWRSVQVVAGCTPPSFPRWSQELELNQSNFDTVATQAAVLAGFAVCMIATRQSILRKALKIRNIIQAWRFLKDYLRGSIDFNSIEHIDDENWAIPTSNIIVILQLAACHCVRAINNS